MKHTYQLTGMTCGSCVASVKEILSKVDGVANVNVDLKRSEVEISMKRPILIHKFESALPDKYSIWGKGDYASGMENGEITNAHVHERENKPLSKLQQLKPLLLIFLYLFTASFLVHFKDWDASEAMLDFMGLFYIVFSFFKLLDLKGFSESFRMYDPMAKGIPIYGWSYPFIELTLGLLLLMRFQITVALIGTIVILGSTTIGVTKTLLDKKNIRCACLGTALKLPMTEATFIENMIMLAMAISMLTMSA